MIHLHHGDLGAFVDGQERDSFRVPVDVGRFVAGEVPQAVYQLKGKTERLNCVLKWLKISSFINRNCILRHLRLNLIESKNLIKKKLFGIEQNKNALFKQVILVLNPDNIKQKNQSLPNLFTMPIL
jgi:hypothetical protein